METLIRTSACTLPLLAVIAMVIWWRLPEQRWMFKVLLLLLVCFAVYGTAGGPYLGTITLVLAYWCIMLISIIGTFSLRSIIGVARAIIMLLVVFTTLIFASYVRFVPKSDAFARCTIQQYVNRIEEYKEANQKYPVDIYARGQDNPETLQRNLIDDITRACRTEEGVFYTLYGPNYSVIRYDRQGDGYLLRGFYMYDPLLINVILYRTCTYDIPTDTVSCHFQIDRPFEPPLDNR